MGHIPRGFDAGNCNLFVILPGQSFGPRDAVDPTGRVFVSAGCSPGIPAAGLFDIHRNEDADFVEVPQGKLGCGETALSRTLGIGECQLVILLEDTFVSTEKPFTDSHLCLRLALSCRQRIVMQGQRGIEVAAELAKFICSTHLDLCLGESMIGSLLDIDTRHIEIGSQEGFGHADLR